VRAPLSGKNCTTGCALTGGIWLSGAFHGHFVDLYSSFKLGISHLSVQDKEKKCPVIFVKGDVCCDDFVEALNNLLCLDTKK
jgi:hypothetical protein